mgnify:CR=1 FL=1
MSSADDTVCEGGTAMVQAITAAFAVAWFIRYLRTRPMTVFGWYRLAAAIAGETRRQQARD